MGLGDDFPVVSAVAQIGEHHHILGIIFCEGLLEFPSEILGFPLGLGEAQAGLFRRDGLFFFRRAPQD